MNRDAGRGQPDLAVQISEYTYFEQKDLRQIDLRQKLFLSEMRQNPLGRIATKFLCYQIIEPDFQQNK